jgi:predicted DsbA family dithiol-disulfide isomerase
LEDLFAGRNLDIPQMLARWKAVAEELGLPLGQRTMTYNSRLAQELAKWAEAQGRGDEYHDAIFRAYFVDGQNIGQVGVLIGIAQSIGLPGPEARAVLEERNFKTAVDADWLRSRHLGITGVPTFVIHDRGLVGAQPYEALEELLVNAGVKRKR